MSGHIDFVCAQATAFSSVVSPTFCSRSFTSFSNLPGPFVGQSSRSDWSPMSRSRLSV